MHVCRCTYMYVCVCVLCEVSGRAAPMAGVSQTVSNIPHPFLDSTRSVGKW